MRSFQEAFKELDELMNGKAESIIEVRLIGAFKRFGVDPELQVKVGGRRLDMLIGNINIECDGKEFHSREKDAERDLEITRYGYVVIRVPGSTIHRNPLATACYIMRWWLPQYFKNEMLEFIPKEPDYKLFLIDRGCQRFICQ